MESVRLFFFQPAHLVGLKSYPVSQLEGAIFTGRQGGWYFHTGKERF